MKALKLTRLGICNNHSFAKRMCQEDCTANDQPLYHHQPKYFKMINTANFTLSCSYLTVSGKALNILQLQRSSFKYTLIQSLLLTLNLRQTLVLNFRIQTLL
jgi:hypothetical protein